MNLTAISSPLAAQTSALSQHDEMAARNSAQEFEAMLLTQMTAAMNEKDEDDDSALFSGSSTSYYQQMFSEQIAKVLAKQGGVGFANSVVQQLQIRAGGTRSLGTQNRAADTIRALQQEVSGATKPSADTEASENLQVPIEGRITSYFGKRQDPINGQQKNHSGLDIAAPRGTPIEAAAAGKVIFSGWRGGYGNQVVVEQADGKQISYAHAEQLLVKVGDRVQAGQTIATVGSTGRSTGPHLHFEIRENGRPVNPLPMITKDFSQDDR